MLRVYEMLFGIVCFGRNMFFVHRQLAFGILGCEIAACPLFCLLKVSISLYIQYIRYAFMCSPSECLDLHPNIIYFFSGKLERHGSPQHYNSINIYLV